MRLGLPRATLLVQQTQRHFRQKRQNKSFLPQNFKTGPTRNGMMRVLILLMSGYLVVDKSSLTIEASQNVTMKIKFHPLTAGNERKICPSTCRLAYLMGWLHESAQF